MHYVSAGMRYLSTKSGFLFLAMAGGEGAHDNRFGLGVA